MLKDGPVSNNEQVANATFRTYEGENVDLWVFEWNAQIVQFHMIKATKEYRAAFNYEMSEEEALELARYIHRKTEEIYGTYDQESGD